MGLAVEDALLYHFKVSASAQFLVPIPHSRR
jgi:hypothetical protein